MNKRSLLAVLLVFMLAFSSFAAYADGHGDENGYDAEENGYEMEENGEAADYGDDEAADEDEMDEEAVEEDEEEVDEDAEADEDMEEDVEEDVEEEMEAEEIVAAEKIQLNLGNEIAIINDEEQMTMDLAPFVDENNRTLVPLRFIGEQLGADIDWDGEERAVTYTKDETVIVLTIDSNVAMVNGEEVEMDSAPVIHAESERTVVPVRFVSEQMGYDVEWVEATRIIIITEKTDEPVVEEEPAEEEAVEEEADLEVDFDEEAEEASVDMITATPDFENNSLTIEGAVTGDAEMVSIGVGALRYVDEREYDETARGHQGFDIPVEEDGSFAITLVEGGSWPAGDNWHGLRSGTHQVRAAILDDEGEIVSFMDSAEFTVE